MKNITNRVCITDSNTLYVGKRSNAVDHLRLAYDHGFSQESLGIPAIIADGLLGHDDDDIQIDLSRVKSAKVGSLFFHSDAVVCLTHCTGHIQTGFGGSIKNLGMGCASRAGKLEQHSDVHPRVNSKICNNCSVCFDYCPEKAITEVNESAFINEEKCIGCGECLVVCKVNAVKMRWDEDSIRVQEKMAEYAFSLHKLLKGKIGYVNYLLRVTKDCDCMGGAQPAVVEDIGILASSDLVAIDKASIDLIIDRSGKDILRAGYNVDWSVQLKHGEKIGLGSMDYDLIELA